jgi:hypothetical protein
MVAFIIRGKLCREDKERFAALRDCIRMKFHRQSQEKSFMASYISAFLALLAVGAGLSLPAEAAVLDAKMLAPHKAVYDVDLVATHSGSQIINISGQMTYEWKPSCDAWVTDHHFNLFYEYADSPGMRIQSNFSTFEPLDGKSFFFTSRRTRDGEMYQELRGKAQVDDAGGKAVYTLPENMNFTLTKGTLFPIGHTLELVRKAKAGEKFYTAQVFDGSDEEGPIEINAFIGGPVKTAEEKKRGKKIDAGLLKSGAWNVRMAVFPGQSREEESDYEMSMVFHENGLISDMLIEYDDFSVKQTLVSLEPVEPQGCTDAAPIPKKP